jgi:MFS family permease
MGMPTGQEDSTSSPWSPFRHRVFTVIWLATVVSNIGGWMYNAGSGWLMTELTADPLQISLVQVASGLPMFLFALPSGVLADIVDKQKFLVIAEIGSSLVSAAFAALVSHHMATPGLLLAFMFLIGAGGAMTIPAWQAIVPKLVPPHDLAAAVAANSVGINISRAVGPALAGTVIAALGIAAPFWLNAASNLATLGALIWWRAPVQQIGRLPPERFVSALRAGLRHARYNEHLLATLWRAVAFFPFASAYWALLPLVARRQIAGGPALYGMLLGAIGLGAIGGAFALPTLKARIGPDWLVRAGTAGTAATLFLYGLAREPVSGLVASGIAGASWIFVLASLNVSTQAALPDWVRGRGLSIFVTTMFASMTLGSILWGKLATVAGVPMTLFAAAACALLAIPLTLRYKLQTGSGLDLTPSMHWPAPIGVPDVTNDSGPVLVTVTYRVSPDASRAAFLNAVGRLSRARGRDGAYRWAIYVDNAEADLYMETFLVESWLAHMRQHERVTNADRALQESVYGLLTGRPEVRHLTFAAFLN